MLRGLLESIWLIPRKLPSTLHSTTENKLRLHGGWICHGPVARRVAAASTGQARADYELCVLVVRSRNRIGMKNDEQKQQVDIAGCSPGNMALTVLLSPSSIVRLPQCGQLSVATCSLGRFFLQHTYMPLQHEMRAPGVIQSLP